jgi:hypothetical protein
MPGGPATQKAESNGWPEQKHETFSEKQMKAKRHPEPVPSCRDVKFIL